MPITSATAAASTRSARDVQYSSVSSSSQFFMNRPTTSCPCCFRSHAATDESTPPDIPTTTRCLRVTNSPSQKRKRQGTCDPCLSESDERPYGLAFALVVASTAFCLSCLVGSAFAVPFEA